MERALIYTTVGKSEEYLTCLEWFCKSLTYTSRITINLLVICDESFHSIVLNTLKQFAFLNYYLMDVPNSNTCEEASKHKTKIFEFPQVFHFTRILFVDLDCIFLGDISSILNTPMNDNKLYVWPERLQVENNYIIYFCLSREDNINACYYNDAHRNFLYKHNKLPFNAGLFMFRSSKLMEQHFNKLNHFMDNFKGTAFFEQSFMNTYFHLNNLSDYSIFNYDNVIMGLNGGLEPDKARIIKNKTFHSEFEKINTTIAHFSGGIGAGISKATLMANYYNKYKQINPIKYNEYETRNEMIKQLIPEGATIVEIGVFQGDFAEVLADTNPKHLYLVDCWEPQGTCSGDVDGNNMKHFTSGIDLWNSVKERYEFYPNISIHRQYSSEFLKSIEDLSVDVIYIDGDHSYEGVKADLNNAFPKIKKGGWIMGHDYEMNMKKAKHVYNFGVKRAVDEFCLEKGLKVVAKGLDGCVSYAIYVDLDEYIIKEETLCELAEKYGVDKCPAIRHTYTPRYHELLASLRKTIKTVLEIGIENAPLMKSIVGENYKPGASLRMWRDYFPNAQIIGCDILRSLLFNDEERIKTFFVDQSNEISLLDLAHRINVNVNVIYLDLIIDDGSHIEEHMILSFKTLWKYVKPNGGIYIIEDIKQISVARFTTVAKELEFTDAELIYTHNGSDYWDGFVAFRKQ